MQMIWYFAFSSYFLTIEKNLKHLMSDQKMKLTSKTLPLNYLENIILKLLCQA